MRRTAARGLFPHPGAEGELGGDAGGDSGQEYQANLHPVCGYHHGLKTFGGWKIRRTTTGQLIWTSPAGIDYPTTPPAYTLPTTTVPDQAAF